MGVIVKRYTLHSSYSNYDLVDLVSVCLFIAAARSIVVMTT